MRQRASQGGFSIAELVTGVAITLVVAGIAIPKLSSLATQYQLVSASNQIAFDIGRTRMKAVGENIFSRVRFGSANQYYVERSTDGVTFTVAEGPISVPKSISVGLTEVIWPTFTRQGLALVESNLILTNKEGRTKMIRVNRLGRVTIQ